jgi:hypothetical protein
MPANEDLPQPVASAAPSRREESDHGERREHRGPRGGRPHRGERNGHNGGQHGGHRNGHSGGRPGGHHAPRGEQPRREEAAPSQRQWARGDFRDQPQQAERPSAPRPQWRGRRFGGGRSRGRAA